MSRSTKHPKSIFVTESNTYASVKSEVADVIKRKFGYFKGTGCGLRSSPSDEWRICVYWYEGGHFVRRRIGKLSDVLAQIKLEKK